MAPNFRVADPPLPPAAPPIPLYCLSTIWASHIDVLGRAHCTASEIFRDTNTNTAQWGEWHLYGVLTPCKSLRLSLGTGARACCTATACRFLVFRASHGIKGWVGRFDINQGQQATVPLPQVHCCCLPWFE